MKKFWKSIYMIIMAIAFASFLTTGCGSSKEEKPVLNIYSWADYYDPEVLAEFEKKYNCEITYDVYSNNEELLAKMQAGGAQFDVIQPSDYMVSTMLKLDMLEKLDHSKIPNLQNITPALRHPKYDPNQEYSAAYVWGLTGIVYNKRYVKETPTSWQDLWNPKYKGHVILLNDCREVFSLALKKHGRSNNTTDPQQIEEAYRDLKKLNENVLAFDTENIKPKFISEEAWIGQMWSGDAAYSYTENPNLGFVIPKEGTLIWADNLAIPKGCKHKDLAEKFINYMYDPAVSARNFNYSRLPNANEKAWPLMDPAIINNPVLQEANRYLERGEWLHDIGDGIRLYDKHWTELKTGN